LRWKQASGYTSQLVARSNRYSQFLADPTNGRAYATMLHPSVCRLSVTYVLSLNGVYCRKTVWWSKWEMTYGNRMVTWPMTSRDPERTIRLGPSISKTAIDAI